MCSVSVANDIDIAASTTYSLVRATPTTANIAAIPLVTFGALSLEDAGMYQCFMSISSPYISHNITLVTFPLEIAFICEFMIDKSSQSDTMVTS